MSIRNESYALLTALKHVPVLWNGKEAIRQMKENGYGQWRQMEWIGFYFQFLCEKHLSDVLKMPGPTYGKTSFDGLGKYPWDFKAHALNTSQHQIIVNDREAIEKAIRDYGKVGLILSCGKVTYNDESRTFQKWHDKMKGKTSKYVLERIKRGAWSRLRKVDFTLNQIVFLKITEGTLKRAGNFQKNFRNSDGSPRRAKVLIDLERMDPDIIRAADFPLKAGKGQGGWVREDAVEYGPEE